MSKGSIIAFAKVNKWFGDFHVLRDIDLSVTKGERIVICGTSIDAHGNGFDQGYY